MFKLNFTTDNLTVNFNNSLALINTQNISNAAKKQKNSVMGQYETVFRRFIINRGTIQMLHSAVSTRP